MLWEYQIGATYPSVNIDANPAEARASAWHCWAHQVDGYLNWGAAQFEENRTTRPLTQDPLVWPDLVGQNGAAIVYPGKNEVLPSTRFARFRDGVDDFDYLSLLAEKHPGHPLLAEIRRLGRDAYASVEAIDANRRSVAGALQEN